MSDDDDQIVVAVDGDEHADAFSDRGGNNGNDNDVSDDVDDDDDEDAVADGEALSCLLLQLTPVKAQVEFSLDPVRQNWQGFAAVLPFTGAMCGDGPKVNTTVSRFVVSGRGCSPVTELFALRGVSTVTLPRP